MSGTKRIYKIFDSDHFEYINTVNVLEMFYKGKKLLYPIKHKAFTSKYAYGGQTYCAVGLA